MNTRFLTLLILFFCLAGLQATAQELNIDVTIDRSRVDNQSLDFLNNFEREIESYLNDFDWTDRSFSTRERINGEMQVTLLSVDDNFNFRANVIIQSQRPIYNTLRETTLFLFNDENWTFNYTPNRGLIHDQLQFDAVATFLDFYAYLILGFDFDSFSELGGTPYFSEAENVVSIAQTSSSTGWSRSGGNRRNRAQLIEELVNRNYEGLRRAVYTYHRQGLDQFLSNTATARENILQSLEMIRQSKQVVTSNFLFDTFFNAKYREIASIFEDAPAEVRKKAYNVLADIDQSHLNTYDSLQ